MRLVGGMERTHEITYPNPALALLLVGMWKTGMAASADGSRACGLQRPSGKCCFGPS